MKRISSSEEICNTNKDIILHKFKASAYPSTILREAESRAAQKERTQLLQPKARETLREDRTVFISKYSTHNKNIKQTILTFWPLFQTEPDFKGIFQQAPTFAYQRTKNLKQLLNQSLDTPRQKYKGTIPCQNCGSCNNIITGTKLMHPTKGTRSNLKSRLDVIPAMWFTY